MIRHTFRMTSLKLLICVSLPIGCQWSKKKRDGSNNRERALNYTSVCEKKVVFLKSEKRRWKIRSKWIRVGGGRQRKLCFFSQFFVIDTCRIHWECTGNWAAWKCGFHFVRVVLEIQVNTIMKSSLSSPAPSQEPDTLGTALLKAL